MGFGKRSVWGLLCALGLSWSARAAIYQYHPSSPLHLAGGFDPLRPFELTLPCIEYDSIKNVDTQGATKTLFSLSLVKSRQELFHHLQLSASLSAQYYFFSAGGGVSLEEESTFHADSLTWIVKAGSDYGRYILENPKLNLEAKGLIDRGEYDRFARRCGTEVVLEERRGAMVAAVFSVESLSQENKRRLEASFKGGVDLGFFDASLSTEYKDFYQFATSMGKLKLDVFALGGTGVTALKDLVQTKPYDLQKVSQILADYTSSLTPENAVPQEYLSASMDRFGWEGTELAIAHRNYVLSGLYHLYRDYESIARRLDLLIRHSSDPLPEEVLKRYREQYTEYLASMQTLRDAAVECDKNSEECRIPPISPSTVIWPKEKNDWDLCEAERNWAFRENLIDAGELRLYRNRNLAPLFKVRGDRLSGIDGWFACSIVIKENGLTKNLNHKRSER